MKDNIPVSLCIFDLDGVIVDTAKYHYVAWKQLASELGYELTKEKNENLKGVSRVQSLDLILEWAGIILPEEDKRVLATQKNERYVDLIQGLTAEDALPGVVAFICELKESGIKTAIGSASKNARLILDKLEMTGLFDAIVDGTMTQKGKPDPEVFLIGAKMTDTPAENAVVFEDAAKGIDAALSANMVSVGVGSEDQLGHAHFVIPGFAAFSYTDFIEKMSIVKKI